MTKSFSLLSILLVLFVASCSLPGDFPEEAPGLLAYVPEAVAVYPVRPALSVEEEMGPRQEVPSQPAPPLGAVDIDNVARMLAGMPARFGTIDGLAGWRQTSWWDTHRSEMDALYVDFMEGWGGAIERWRTWEIGDLEPIGNLFYPFSGPDFLFANALFPTASHHLMIGLETPDALPDFGQVTEADLAFGLDGLRHSLGTVLDYSFFITTDMRQDFAKTKLEGVLPPLLVFLARSGHRIDLVQEVGLLPDGTLEKRSVAWESHPAPGLLLQVRDQWGRPKDVVYLREDLSDATLGNDKRLLSYASARVPAVTFFKSASYLCHEAGFSTIRRFAEEFSSAIVQDASGLPFRDFSPQEWDIRLYGNYTKTLDIFSEHFQPDLRDAFVQGQYPVKAMEFGLGYEYNWDVTAVIVARRRALLRGGF